MRLLLATLAVLALMSPHHATARSPVHRAAPALVARHVRYPLGSSLVRCSSLRQPGSAGRSQGSRRPVRLFAPTSQAVFFAHAGDRCIWRAGAPVHG